MKAKKDTKFQRKYASNAKVQYAGKTWTVCKEAQPDSHKHLHYKLSRGSLKTSVRGDKLATA